MGKSLIYFLATRILRKAGKGPTIIFSPLVALMNNQLVAARKFFDTTESVRIFNSYVTDANKKDTVKLLKNDKVDILFVTPESIKNEFFEDNISSLLAASGFVVIDEAHCISDWGHDFRPDYMNIVKIIDILPPNVPVLATTATANDRVIRDIETQLHYTDVENGKIIVLRGNLQRENLFIQVVNLKNHIEKLAWLGSNIPLLKEKMKMPGIIYCATINDCQIVAGWLKKLYPLYSVEVYNSEAKNRVDIENDFLNDRIDILVATSAFGMGIDKPNIGYVIHYSKPKNVIEYYQQIGRAGRSTDIKLTYAILLASPDDDDINKFFIKNAFAKTEELMNVIDLLKSNQQGLRQFEIEKKINCSHKTIEKILKYLVAKDAIHKQKVEGKNSYFIKNREWQPDVKHMQELTAQRLGELGDMNDYLVTDKCYMEYITGLLNDMEAKTCKNCATCTPQYALSCELRDAMIKEAESYISGYNYDVDIRKKWTNYKVISVDERIKGDKIFVLTKYSVGEYGKLVKQGKYGQEKPSFSDILVDAAARKLQQIVIDNEIKYIVPIPSLNHPDLVPDFANKLAEKLNCKYLAILEKNNTVQQKSILNSCKQQLNIENSLNVKECAEISGNVLLVDDMVDSRWTLTVAASKLVKYASEKGALCSVYAFALANSVSRDDNND